MKVIFLDHYGVMVTSSFEVIRNEYSLPSSDELKSTRVLDDFNRICVRYLNDIISRTDAEIVLISDWMRYLTLDEVSEFYSNQGVIKSPIGYVNGIGNVRESRVSGILNYLSENKIEKYVCVDDIHLEINNFVWCQYPSVGICGDGIKDKILSYLV